MSLRDYQHEGIAAIRAALRAGHRRVIRQLPTGGGKTVELTYICESAAARGSRVCIMAHRAELTKQISNALTIPHGFIQAGVSPRRSLPVQVASVQTLVNRVDQYDFDILIIDECHHTLATTYSKIIAAYPRAVVIGFTATPERLDGKSLGDVYDHMVLGPSVKELTRRGYLKPAEYIWTGEALDLSGIHTVAGDFNRSELAGVLDKPRITGDAIDHYRRYADGLPAILFGVNVEHIRHCAEQFNAAGYRFVALDGTMDRRIIQQALLDLAERRIHGVCSCDLISEGVDVPVVSAGIMLRPTWSLALWLQQVGRCLRPAAGYPKAIILDHAGNIRRHGIAEIDRDWTLEPRAKRKRRIAESDDDVQVSHCPECFRVHERAPVCPNCGYEYPVQRREIETVPGELAPMTDAEKAAMEAKLRARKEQGMARTLDDLVALAAARGYSKPDKWAKYVYESRQKRAVA